MNKQPAKSRTVRFKASNSKPPTRRELEQMRRDAARQPDLSDIPEITKEQFERMAKLRRRRLAAAGYGSKERVTMFLDKDIVTAFRESGSGYQTRINEALRQFLIQKPVHAVPTDLIGQAIQCLALAKTDLETVSGRK